MRTIVLNKDQRSGVRLYRSEASRNNAIARLKRSGHDYFTKFRDVDPNFPFGLSFGDTRCIVCSKPGGLEITGPGGEPTKAHLRCVAEVGLEWP